MGNIVKVADRVTRSCALGIIFAACAALPSAAAAAPAPAWSIVVSSYPTRFAGGTTGGESSPPGYLLRVTNYGGAATNGVFTITSTLPAGLSFSTAAGAFGSYGGQQTKLSCSIAAQTISCSGGKPKLQPGETARLIVPVSVAPGSPGAVVDEATISGGGAAAVTASTETTIGSGLPPFDFLPGAAGLDGAVSKADGSAATLAGSHPYQFRGGMNFPTGFASGELFAVGGGIRDLSLDLPEGMVVDPGAVPARCTESELEGSGCPDTAQVGTVTLAVSLVGGAPSVETAALYEMVPPPGMAVEFGLEVIEGVAMHLLGRVHGDNGYALSAEINHILAKSPILGAEVTLWGRPSDESHDHVRGDCISSGAACPVERTNRALLTLPGACGFPLTITASADSWLEPGVFSSRGIEGPVVEGCNALSFDPTLSVKSTTAVADSPTGLEVDVHLPQSNDYEGLAEAGIRDAQVTLPEGVTVNPSGAYGLGACSASEVGLTSAIGQVPVRFTASPASCPDNAKIGTAEIDTPILAQPLTGGVYLAKPDENPFGSLLAVYVTIDDTETGIVFKLAGRIEADSRTGRLTLHLDELPQLPIEDIELDLFQGSRSILKTPLECGSHRTTSDLTPWSSPEGVNATPSDTFVTAVAPSGGVCPADEAQAPNRPSFSAGTVSPQAGAYSSFVLRLSREDGSQRLAAVDATLPPGVTARLAGAATCSDAQVTAASCPPASEVGTVGIAAGAGATPLHLSGHAYLAGPYKGAPLSLAIVVPALAGPFDLGTVVVRVALDVDARSAQIHAVSDPLPTILQGVPLDLRSIEVDLDRPGFIRSPTSCEPMAITGSATTSLDQVAALSNRFQVGDCAALAFKPKLAISLSGAIGRGGHPALRAVLRSDPDGAAPARMEFALPADELLDLRHIGALCSRGLEPDHCPAASRLGSLSFDTPLLDAPLSGSVYLRSPGKRLPDLVADLRSGPLHFVLEGHTASASGRLRVRFRSIPDIPLSKAVLSLAGGRRGIIVNSRALCSRPSTAGARFAAHNGKRRRLRVPIRLGNRC